MLSEIGDAVRGASGVELDLCETRRAQGEQKPNGVGPRRGRLRDLSAALHGGLEARLEASGCFDSRIGYATYLARIAPLYAALEGVLDEAGAEHLLRDWPRRRKAGLIRADLRSLGMGEVPASPTGAMVAAALPSRPNAGTVLGALYVLEGATLGGAVLARRMARLGLARERGAAFLDPYGADRGAMWRAYLRVLEEAELAPDEVEELGPAAVATFALFAAVAAPLVSQSFAPASAP